MAYLISGAVLLFFVLGLFWLKDELRSPRLARLAYSEFTMRLAVIAAGLMLVGAVVIAGDVWSRVVEVLP
ncbi:MAG: hypothetical protein KDJ45_01180 [Hyphomicrobiaceae bacterium]|nr:hypothetical protein [Hyphomicrobiaceae bacterium]MCC0011347.1 hypothetical protein [Hyphomicrobiaceae bacterium]